MNRNRAPRVLIALLVAALSLVLVVSALAAHPKAGRKYTGFTSAPASRGLRPPVSFKVRRDAKRLLGFRFSEGDCGGLGGPADPWTSPYHIVRVGTIKVSSRGTFSVKNVKWRFPSGKGDQPKVATSTVNGRFTTARKATGTLRFTVKIGGTTCPQSKATFSATTS